MDAEGPQRQGEDEPSVAVVGRAQRGRVAVAEPPRQLGLRLGGIEGRIRNSRDILSAGEQRSVSARMAASR
jgi:hypothetical protein